MSPPTCSQLDAAASVASATLAAALEAVEASGFAPDLIVTTVSAWSTLAPQAAPPTYAGLDVVIAPGCCTTYVVGRAGVGCQSMTPAQLLVTEPRIGGIEIAAMAGVVRDVQSRAVRS